MHANECNKMFIIHTRVASCLFPREVSSNSPFECKVTEGVSGHAADFLLFSGLYPFRLIPFCLIPFRLTKLTHVPFRLKFR